MFSRIKLNCLLKYVSIFVLLYILILCCFVKSPEMFHLPSFIIVAILAAIAISCLIFVILLQRQAFYRNNYLYFSILSLLVVVPRAIWIRYVDTAPVSDFFLYQNYAANASRGIFDIYDKTYQVFPFKFGYPLTISLFYKLFGTTDTTVIKILNIVLSLALALIVFWIGKNIFDENTGKLAGLIVALHPAQIMYTSVLASEHVFIVFFALAAGFIVKAVKASKAKKQYAFLALSGVFLAPANFNRPVAIILLPVLFIWLLFSVYEDLSFIKRLLKTLPRFTAALLSYIIVFSILTMPVSKIIGQPIYKSSSGFSMLLGTNYIYNGRHSAEDETILKEFNFNYDWVHKEAYKRSLLRIVLNPQEFAYLVERKTVTQWANEDYGPIWSTTKFETDKLVSDYIIKYPYLLIFPNHFFYMTVLLFALMGVFLLNRNNKLILPSLLTFLGFYASSVFLEVQSRYHYPAMPALIILSSFGAIESINFLSTKRAQGFAKFKQTVKKHRILISVIILATILISIGGYVIKGTPYYNSIQEHLKRLTYEINRKGYMAANAGKSSTLTVLGKDENTIEIYSRLKDGKLLLLRFLKKEWGVWNIGGWYIAEDDKMPTKNPLLTVGGGSDWEYVFRVSRTDTEQPFFSGGNHGKEKLYDFKLYDGDTNKEITLNPDERIEVNCLKIKEYTSLAFDQSATSLYADVVRDYTVFPAKIDFESEIRFTKDVFMSTSYVCMLPTSKYFGRYIKFNDSGNIYSTSKIGAAISGDEKSNYLGKEKTLSVDIWGDSYLPYKFRVWIDNENMVDGFRNDLKVFYWDFNSTSNKLYFSKFNENEHVKVSKDTTWKHNQGWELIIE